MDISHLTSQSFFNMISLAEKKEELLQLIAEIDAEMIKILKGGAISVVRVLEVGPAAKTISVVPAKPAKAAKKSKMSPEGRARISAATKARWAARRAGNGITAKAVVAPKAAKPAKAKKKGISPEGRAKIAAAATARWAAVRAAKAAGKPAAPAKARKNAKA